MSSPTRSPSDFYVLDSVTTQGSDVGSITTTDVELVRANPNANGLVSPDGFTSVEISIWFWMQIRSTAGADRYQCGIFRDRGGVLTELRACQGILDGGNINNGPHSQFVVETAYQAEDEYIAQVRRIAGSGTINATADLLLYPTAKGLILPSSQTFSEEGSAAPMGAGGGSVLDQRGPFAPPVP